MLNQKARSARTPTRPPSRFKYKEQFGVIVICPSEAAQWQDHDVTAALSAVGLGSVPSWLRPYSVLSNGERFRADMARLICEAPVKVVVDEFTSPLDRQVARFGALAFAGTR